MDIEEVNPPVKSCKITCSDVPPELLDRNIAKQHFRRFGRVLRITMRPRSRSCTIEYDCTENAQKAILNGGEYMGHVFAVNWFEPPMKRKQVKKDPDPDWLPDPEIQEELNAMAAMGREYFKKDYNLRPEGMTVDEAVVKQPSAKIKKVLKRTWKAENTKKVKTKTKTAAHKSKAWTPEQLELLNILKQPAITAEEKFKVLETRDKLIRLRTKKRIDLKRTTHTVGTCPDMCPEKERLMREVQHQVAVYEQDSTGKGMNPHLAIKQYSRSSADQEVPLPHDLRPVSVLQLTMGYLMHRIMNLCDIPDVNLAEWFHFLWDRSRSIRKDITQQELCCQGSVALLEQCARFHIHCSARLVAEDPSVFDQKINTENLTKCLQTLKYMYHDLNLKGESCPNEAEFRAYIILLNLNDGNFMWEVQQLKPEIQKSPEIKFALAAYSAIDKNNFVKFFKLVHSTGYLNACILLRYFVQVRTRALSTILKCYSPRAPYTQFPLLELGHLLAFEDTVSMADFVVSYGLYLNPEETHVILDRKNFQLPEISYSLDRAINVVETKRRGSVGEVVYGGPLPPPDFQNYAPFNSFSDDGLFIITGTLANIIKEAESAVPASPDVLVVQDQVDSAKASVKKRLAPPVFQQQDQFAKSSAGIFGPKLTSIPEDNQNILPDPSLPFWSIKTDPTPTPTNIFKIKEESSTGLGLFGTQKPKDDQTSSSFKQFTFDQPIGNDQSKMDARNLFGEQSKQSIFGEQAKQNIFGEVQRTNIFGEQSNQSVFGEQSKSSTFRREDPRTVQNVFGGGYKPTESTKFGETESTDAVPQKPGFGDSTTFTSANIFAVDQIQEPRISSTVSETKPSFAFDRGLVFSTSTTTTNQISFGQPTMASTKPFVPTSRSPIKSSQPDIRDVEEKARLEELEKQRKLQKEKEEQLKREMEEMKQKAELRKRQLEEEKQRKEKERLEMEKKKRLEEEKRKALIEKERKLALEIKRSVKTLMDDLLTKVEKKVKEERLKEISISIRKHKMSLFVQKWQKQSATNKRKRQAMDQNPIWLPSRTTKEEAQELFTDTQSLTLQNIKRYKFGKSIELALPPKEKVPKMNVAYIYKILLNSCCKIYQRLLKEMFWKVTVSFPDFREFKVGLHHVEDVLTDIFEWKDRYGSTAIVGQYTGENRLNYAVEKKQGVHTVESNSNGLLFISNEPNDLLLQRIRESLKNFPKCARVPIAVIFVNNNTSAICPQNTEKILEANKHVTNYDILACKFTNTALINAVEQSLVFLAQSIEKTPPLELNMLKAFLDVHLATELWKRVASYAVWNSTYKSCLKLPSLVISLYNDAVDRLKEIALDRSCLEYSNFPDEFEKLLLDPNPVELPTDYKYFPIFWKTDSYRCLLINAMNSLKLPKFQANWPPTSAQDLERNIFTYCSEVFEQPQTSFYKIMAVILRNVDPVNDFSKIKNVLWTDVIEIIAMEKLKVANFSLRHTEFHSKSVFQQLVVVYNRKTLDAYRHDEWFYLKHPLVEAEIKQNVQKNKKKKTLLVPPLNFSDDFDLDELEKSIRNDDDQINRKRSADIQELLNSMADLEESITIQKKTCLMSKEHLKKALDISK